MLRSLLTTDTGSAAFYIDINIAELAIYKGDSVSFYPLEQSDTLPSITAKAEKYLGKD